MKSSFDAFKAFSSSFYETSKKSIGNIVSSLTMTEADYLYKTEATEKEIVQYLMSKMEMEVILGLKIIISNIQSDKDVSSYMPRIFEIFTISKDYNTKLLCLCIIDHLTLKKRSESLLLFNIIAKCANDPDVLNRMLLLHIIASLRGQDIAGECSKMLIPFTADSNPLLRRMALIVIVHYIKINGDDMQISHEEFELVLRKYLLDPHPMVSSTFFYAISELGNRDYIALMVHSSFERICEVLSYYDDPYLERAVYCLINFTKTVLIHNIEKNIQYIMKLFNQLYYISKHSTDSGRILCAVYGLYELLADISKSNYALPEKHFKSNKQLKKIARILIHLVLLAEDLHAKHYLVLQLIQKFIQSARATSSHTPFCIIKKELSAFLNYFFIKYNDTQNEYIPSIKLDIITELATELNIKAILEELERALNYPSAHIKVKAVLVIEAICNGSKANEQMVPLCIEALIDLLKVQDEVIINQVILSLTRLIAEVKEQKQYVLIYSIKNFKKTISSPSAKANIIWMISNCLDCIPTVIVDFYRRLLIDIDKERAEIKLQVIGLSYKIHCGLEKIIEAYEEGKRGELKQKIEGMVIFAIEKMLYDNDYFIREKARIVKAFIASGVTLEQNKERPRETMRIKKLSDDDNSHCLLSLGYLNDGLDQSLVKFSYDVIDKELADKMKSISFEELIKATAPSEQALNAPNSKTPNAALLQQDKYTSCTNESNIGTEISNFNSGLNLDEKKKALKNQLDEFLNGNDDDDDDVVIEIKHDTP